MTARTICFLFILIATLPVYSVYSLSSDNATILIKGVKKSFKKANEKIAETALQDLQKNKDNFSQTNKSEEKKVELLFGIFADCNTAGLNEAQQYIVKNKKMLQTFKEMPAEDTQNFLITLATISTQIKPRLKLKVPLSDELSTYIEQIKNILEDNTKSVLQAIFKYLQQSCPELDPNILSD